MTLQVGDRVKYVGKDEDFECAVGTVEFVPFDGASAVSVQWDKAEYRTAMAADLEKVSGRLVNSGWGPARWPADTRDGVADAGAQGSSPAVADKADAGAAAHIKRERDKREAVQQYRDEHRGVEPELPFDEVHGECPPLDATPIPPAVVHDTFSNFTPMGWYTTHDSGSRQEFDTGSRRDTREGKGRYDLLSVPAVRRLAGLLERGAEKYGDRNWEKGQPLSRYLDSALRHTFQVLDGNRDEDHAAAAMWNLMAFIHTEEKIAAGDLPAELSDLA